MTKKRNKKYQPKRVEPNVFVNVFGGMGATHGNKLRSAQIRTRNAIERITSGSGDKDDWSRLVCAVGTATVMCEQGVGLEYKGDVIAARDALKSVGERAVRNNWRFGFTGDELKAVREAIDIHDAQLENVRAIDVERAVVEFERRMFNRDNTVAIDFSQQAA
jgi:hypothetical protein